MILKRNKQAAGFEPHSSPSEPLALYQQVKKYILDRIQAGKWPPGTRIPSENQLVKTLGVSRMTANRALRELSAEGYLVRMHGVGTFVQEHKPVMTFLEVKSIAAEISAWGGLHSCEIHLLSEEKATGIVAASMGLVPGQPVFHSTIVHKDRNQPVQLSDRYVNPAVAPDYLAQDFSRITPNEYLVKAAPIQETEHVIDAVLPDRTAQKLLDISKNEPCLLLNRRTWSFGQVATKARLLYPGSRYRIGSRFRAPMQVDPL
jgi:GntR family histidine utilization transcriptional repressor